MKSVFLSFKQMLLSIKKDMMLFVACFAPILCGSFFKIVIPMIEKVLKSYFGLPTILTPYYGLFDVFFSLITPAMFCFAAAMVILEEMDEHITGYLAVTPLGKNGYLFSRLGIPTFISFMVTLILFPIFKLTQITLGMILLLSIAGAAQGLISTLIVVSFSSNKLEGMATTKLSSLMLLGVIAPFCIQGSVQYLLAPLPSFWLAKALMSNNILYIVFSIVFSALWVILLMKKFNRRISIK